MFDFKKIEGKYIYIYIKENREEEWKKKKWKKILFRNFLLLLLLYWRSYTIIIFIRFVE